MTRNPPFLGGLQLLDVPDVTGFGDARKSMLDGLLRRAYIGIAATFRIVADRGLVADGDLVGARPYSSTIRSIH